MEKYEAWTKMIDYSVGYNMEQAMTFKCLRIVFHVSVPGIHK